MTRSRTAYGTAASYLYAPRSVACPAGAPRRTAAEMYREAEELRLRIERADRLRTGDSMSTEFTYKNLTDLHTKRSNLARQARQLVEEGHRRRREIDDRWDLDRETKRRATDRLVQELAEKASSLGTEATILEAEIARVTKGVLSPHRQRPTDAATEVRMDAAWRRVEKVLTAAAKSGHLGNVYDTVSKVIDNAAAVGDDATLMAIRRELPAFFEGNRVGDQASPIPPHPEIAERLDLLAGPDDVVAARAMLKASTKSEVLDRFTISNVAGSLGRGILPTVLPTGVGEGMANLGEAS